MTRIQLFEFEDLKWFPDLFRRNMTKLIVVFNKLMKLDEVVSSSLSGILKSHKTNAIVDLGSGRWHYAARLQIIVSIKQKPNFNFI